MTKRLSKPNARGLFPCEKGGHTFYLGTERQEAERRKAAMESIFAASGNQWNCMSKTVAMAVARGDKTLTVGPPAEYIGKTQDEPPCVVPHFEEEAMRPGLKTGLLIDPNIESYQSFVDREWATKLARLTDGTPLEEHVFIFLLNWRSTANAQFMPWLMMNSIRSIWQSYMRPQPTFTDKNDKTNRGDGPEHADGTCIENRCHEGNEANSSQGS